MKILLLWFVLFAASVNDAMPASFPCSPENTPVEKMICEDDFLKYLDVELNSQYKLVLELSDNPGEVKKIQRSWLKTVRDRCTDKSCLKSAYKKQIEALVSSVAVERKCNIHKEQLLGYWDNDISGFFPEFPEFTLESGGKAGSSSSDEGTWSFDKCILNIKNIKKLKILSEEAASAGEDPWSFVSFSFRVLVLKEDKLYLFHGSEHHKKIVVYRRI